MAQEKLQALSTEFFSNLIKLETDFINKTYTAQTLDELIEYYSTAVEYYDSQKDQIAAYWIYKIQDTLAQKKSLKLLTLESQKSATPKENIKDFFAAHRIRSTTSSNASTEGSPNKSRKSFMGGIIAENMEEEEDNVSNDSFADDAHDDEDERHHHDFDLEDDEEELTIDEKRMRAKNRLRGARKSIATLKKKTQKLFTLQMKLQNEKASVRETLHALMGTFVMTSSNNDKLVAANLETQRKSYKERLNRRLNPNCESRSGSMIFIDGQGPNLGTGFLHEVEDKDCSSN